MPPTTATLAAPHITCPGCGATRTLSPRNARRVRNGEYTGLCRLCRHPAPRDDHADRHLRYWLRLYGVDLDPAIDPRQWVREHGLPAGLHELAALYDAACDGCRFTPDHSRRARHRSLHPVTHSDRIDPYERAA